jgi:hypothetical protein
LKEEGNFEANKFSSRDYDFTGNVRKRKNNISILKNIKNNGDCFKKKKTRMKFC